MHGQALMPLQTSLDDVSTQLKEVQKMLAVRKEGNFQVHNAYDAVLANNNSLQWLIAIVVLMIAVLSFATYVDA